MIKKKFIYKKIAIGGTFDHLHIGHKYILRKAFDIGQFVVVGITTKGMIKNKKFFKSIEPYNVRKKRVYKYLSKRFGNERFHIIPLYNAFGTVLKDPSIEAVIAGPRISKKNIAIIQKQKKVVLIKPKATNEGIIISSEQIRQGVLLSDGTCLDVPLQDIYLPSFLRSKLRKPMGKYIGEKNIKSIFKKAQLSICVGDASLILLKDKGVCADIVVVDGRIRRKKVFSYEQIKRLVGEGYEYVHVVNMPGSVSLSLSFSLKKAIKDKIKLDKKTIIFVRGEDDLAVLPAVLFAPLNALVVYGQPAFPLQKIHPGLIGIYILQQTKRKIYKLIKQFNR